VRGDLSPDLRAAITAFVTEYAKSGRNAAAELAKLKLIHDISGFAPASNETLIPFAQIDYTLDRRRALSAQWVSNAAMQARLQKIEGDHERLIRELKANQTLDAPEP
jgi:phosphonate transport system substrate-binding protein